MLEAQGKLTRQMVKKDNAIFFCLCAVKFNYNNLLWAELPMFDSKNVCTEVWFFDKDCLIDSMMSYYIF